MNNSNELNHAQIPLIPNEHLISKKQEQDEFNKRFLIILIIFMFFYNIDQKRILIDCLQNIINIPLENTQNTQNPQNTELEDTNDILIDELD